MQRQKRGRIPERIGRTEIVAVVGSKCANVLNEEFRFLVEVPGKEKGTEASALPRLSTPVPLGGKAHVSSAEPLMDAVVLSAQARCPSAAPSSQRREAQRSQWIQLAGGLPCSCLPAFLQLPTHPWRALALGNMQTAQQHVDKLHAKVCEPKHELRSGGIHLRDRPWPAWDFRARL